MKALSALLFSAIALFHHSFAHADGAADPMASLAPETQAICRKVKTVEFPEADLAVPAGTTVPARCVSSDYYYGNKELPKDFTLARLCALAERKQGDHVVFGGTNLLMMIYANGDGVKKNIPLAERLACEGEAAPAEIDGRVQHLESLRMPIGRFDICDDITSGYMEGFCQHRADQREQETRDAALQTIMAKWTSSEREAFSKLKSAADQFAYVRSGNEVDLSGSGRAAFESQEEAVQHQDFLQSIEWLETDKAPKYTSAQRSEEDKKLNELYKKIQSARHGEKIDEFGTVTKDGVKRTQKAWLAYRNAWVTFAKVRYPKYSSDSIAAWFTKKRNHMLRSLLPES